MLHTNYDIFFLDNFIEKYAQTIEKPIIFLRSYGWNNSKNIDSINSSMDGYKIILPLDVFTSLKNSEFCFLEVDSIEESVEFLQTYFPKSQETCSTPENYIHYSLFNSQGQLILSN